MSPDQFRLVLGVSAGIVALGYLGSVDPVLMIIIIFLGLVGAGLWLCYRIIRWAWQRIN